MSQSSNSTNYLLGGVVVLLVLIVAVLVIRNEGRKMRETVREVAQDAQREVGESAKEGIGDAVREGIHEAGDIARQLPGDILTDVLDIAKGKSNDAGDQPDEPTTKADTSDDEAASGATGEPSETTKADAQPAAVDESTTAAKNTDSEKEFRPLDIVADVFETGRDVARQIDDVAQSVLELDLDDEVQIGKKFHQLLLEEHKAVDSPQQHARLFRLAEPLLEMRDRKGIEYTFTIIDSPEINAFAIPGGYIYFHSGLLEFVETDAQLQFVLGHEMGHVDLKHCIRNFTLAAHAAEIGGLPAEMATRVLYNIYESQFNQDLELEADEYSCLRLHKLGRTREEILSLHHRLKAYYEEQGVETDKPEPTTLPDAIAHETKNHFRSHPPTQKRIDRLEALKLPEPGS
jgi:hypothetical protein